MDPRTTGAERTKREGRMYQKVGGVSRKYVTSHVILLHVYDWRSRVFIDEATIDPGEFAGETMTEDQLKAMQKKTDPSAIAKYVRSMPVR